MIIWEQGRKLAKAEEVFRSHGLKTCLREGEDYYQEPWVECAMFVEMPGGRMIVFFPDSNRWRDEISGRIYKCDGPEDFVARYTPSAQVTPELLAKGESDNGGFSARQIRLLGLSWPPDPGWKERVCGKTIPHASARRFVELKNAHLK